MYTQKIHEHWARPDCTKEFEENDGSVFNGKCPLLKKHASKDLLALFLAMTKVAMLKITFQQCNHGNPSYPPPKATPQEIAGLIKGLLTIGRPAINPLLLGGAPLGFP